MNKKGFTLIELLAVLVVLAILALISIPITIRIINNARENSYKRSIASYAKALENYIATENLENSQEDYGLLYNYANDDKMNDLYSGNRVECDFSNKSNNDEDYSTLINGKLVLRGCHVNNSKLYRYDNSQVIEEIEYKEYEIGEPIVVNHEYYYVIKNSSKTKSYVTALKDTPISYNDIISYGTGYINKNTTCYADAQEYGIPYKGYTYGNLDHDIYFGGVAYYSSDTCCGSLNDGCKTSYDDSDVKHIIDGWITKFNNNQLKNVDGYKARLINISELKNLGYVCGIDYCTNDNETVPEWIYNTPNYFYWVEGYSNDIDKIGFINQGSLIHKISSSYPRGVVRPVINVYKDKIDS